MFESLREAFSRALENFQSELNRDRIPDAADRLLRAMKAELVELQKQSAELEMELSAVAEEAASERRAAETCLRREEMAAKIGDQDTASVAREFAGKHLQRHEILSDKSSVLSRELEERRGNLEELVRQFKEARLRRESLSAVQGLAGARDAMQEAGDLFEDMDRMGERVNDTDAQAEAARSLDLDAQPGHTESLDLDARLDALKQRMRDA
jgi:hypothetical protein